MLLSRPPLPQRAQHEFYPAQVRDARCPGWDKTGAIRCLRPPLSLRPLAFKAQSSRPAFAARGLRASPRRRSSPPPPPLPTHRGPYDAPHSALPAPVNAYERFSDATAPSAVKPVTQVRHLLPVAHPDTAAWLNAVRSLAAPPPQPPPYGRRGGFVPRDDDDYGDGGAFPEVHVAQYPRGLGRKDRGRGNQLHASVSSADGTVRFDAIAKQGQGERTVYSNFGALIERPEVAMERGLPEPEEIAKTAERTAAALQAIVSGKMDAAKAVRAPEQKNAGEAQYIRYTPAQQGAGATQRIIRMSEAQTDPMNPPSFRHKKVPAGPPSPPPPVMHSPPRKVTVQDQQNWKIPPCISNWKNPKVGAFGCSPACLPVCMPVRLPLSPSLAPRSPPAARRLPYAARALAYTHSRSALRTHTHMRSPFSTLPFPPPLAPPLPGSLGLHDRSGQALGR